MDRDQTPAFGLASSLEAMIEASLATSLERHLTAALSQQLETGDSALQDRINASVDAAFQTRIGSATLDSRLEALIVSAFEKHLGRLVATLESPIEAAVSAAIQRRLGNGLSARIFFDVPQLQGLRVATSQNVPTSPRFNDRTTSVSDQHETIEREEPGTLKQEAKSGTEADGTEIMKAADTSTEEAFHSRFSSFVGTSARPVKRESSVFEQVVAPTGEKESLPTANIPKIDTKKSDVAVPPGRAHKETPKKPKILRGMGIQFPLNHPLPSEEEVSVSSDHISGDDTSLFVEQDDETETETVDSVRSTPAKRKADAMQVRLPVSRDRTLSNRYGNLLCELRNGARSAEFKQRTSCAKCLDEPDDAHVVSCLHVYCEECLAALAYDASATDKDEIACLKCLEVCTEAEPCSGLLAEFTKIQMPTIEGTNAKRVSKEAPPEPAKKSKKRTSTPAASEKSDTDAPKRKKAKKADDPPCSTNGPPIKFLLEKESKLTSAARKHGHPRIVDITAFTEETSKQNFTMADIVATILWNYKPETLKAFLDTEICPKFSFVRKGSNGDKDNFVIERERKEPGLVVTCGYQPRQKDDFQREATHWGVNYEYLIEEYGRWIPHTHKLNDLVRTTQKNLIQQQVTELGTKLFLAKVWVEDDGAKISATVWTLEDASKGKAILVKPTESGQTQNGKREDAKPEGGKTQVGIAKVTKADDGKVDVGKANGAKAGGERAKVGKAEDEKAANEKAEGGKGQDEKGHDGTLKGGNPNVGIVAPAHCRT